MDFVVFCFPPLQILDLIKAELDRGRLALLFENKETVLKKKEIK